jgi:hypothetical protein
MAAFWVSIPLGLLIVLLAVACPYWLTHRQMRPPYDQSEAREYLDATGKTPEEAATGRPRDRGRPDNYSNGTTL